MSKEFSHEEEALGKVYDHRLMKRVLHYVKPYWGMMTIGLFFSAEVAALSVVPNLIIKAVIDGPVANGDVRGILWLSGLFLVSLVALFVAMYANTYLLTIIGQKVMRDLRLDLFAHLQRQSLGFYDRTPVGRLMTRMTSDVSALQEIVSSGLVSLVQDVLMLVALLVATFLMDWKLALLTYSTLPFLVITVIYFSRRMRDAFRNMRLALSRVSAHLQESITGMRVIQAFRAEERQQATHVALTGTLRDAHIDTIFLFALFWPLVDGFSALAVAVLAWYAGGLTGTGAVQTGTLVFFILSIERFFWPIRDLSEKYNLFQAAMASSERIFKLMDTNDIVPDPVERHGGVSHEAGRGLILPGGVKMPKPLFERSIKFEDVWFAYQGEDWVLRGIDLEILKGQHVALVGSTGSGKTTMTNLLTRFHDIQKGRITIDGVDIREFALEDLRTLFAVVLQDVFLFTGTIGGNIRLSRELDDARLMEVCRQVNADRFVNSFAEGLGHEVRERGATFSAGERQLLAFARALAYDPAVLVLDEATSNIDTETELLIQDALVKLMKGRTAIVIAHRLSTIQHADQIVVMSRGQIAERGRHQELLAQNGIYRKLYELQIHKEKEQRPEFGDTAPAKLAGAPLLA